MRPEFINRIDEIVKFDALTRDNIHVDTAAGKFFTQINTSIKFEDIEHIPDGQKHGLGTMDLESINIKRVRL